MMPSFAYICRDCNYVLGEAGTLSECPVCGGRRLSVCQEADRTGATSLFQEAAREFDQALDKGDLKTAKRLLGELSSFGHDATTKFTAIVCEWEEAFFRNHEPAFLALCKTEHFEEARSLIAKWKGMGIATEKHEKLILDGEKRAFIRIFERLPAVTGLSAHASHSETAKVDLSWTDVLKGLKGKYCIAKKIGLESISSFTDGEALSETNSPYLTDEKVPLGVPVAYAVVVGYKERINEKTMSVVSNVVCTALIEGFHCKEAAGNNSFGNVSLFWQNPPWDAEAVVESRIVREDGKSWDVSGRDSFVDDSVRAGESHRYLLETMVSGKMIDPVECKVSVETVTDPPHVAGAFVFIQDERPRLSIPNWPEGISEILISRLGLKPYCLLREDYNKKGFFFHTEDEANTATLQAVRRFGSHCISGPACRISFENTSKILFVSIGDKKVAFWKRPEYGLVIRGGEGQSLPPLVVSIENPIGQIRSLSLRVAKSKQASSLHFLPHGW